MGWQSDGGTLLKNLKSRVSGGDSSQIVDPKGQVLLISNI